MAKDAEENAEETVENILTTAMTALSIKNVPLHHAIPERKDVSKKQRIKFIKLKRTFKISSASFPHLKPTKFSFENHQNKIPYPSKIKTTVIGNTFDNYQKIFCKCTFSEIVPCILKFDGMKKPKISKQIIHSSLLHFISRQANKQSSVHGFLLQVVHQIHHT